MLLARKDYRVLLVDKSTFPSDIMSTHYIHIPGVARLSRWGLYDKVMATGCPPIESITLHLDDVELQPPRPELPPDVPSNPICPRRTVLDNILVEGAVEAGAEFRGGFSVQELTFDGDRVTGVRGRLGRDTVEESAKIVIGADGMHSRVAKAVNAPEYNTRETLSFAYYTYWTNVETGGAHIYMFSDLERGLLIFPTNDARTCVAVGGTIDHFHDFRSDIEGNYFDVVDRVPGLREQIDGGEREKFIGTADQPNFFRKPYGDGWALVGDAGYHRDFFTGLGITDAFRDAEYLAEAIDAGFSGREPLEDAMAEYERKRNDIADPLYEVTLQMASGETIDPEAFMRFGAAMARMVPEELPV
jgi:flavin-dependent dehydrogenase